MSTTCLSLLPNPHPKDAMVTAPHNPLFCNAAQLTISARRLCGRWRPKKKCAVTELGPAAYSAAASKTIFGFEMHKDLSPAEIQALLAGLELLRPQVAHELETPPLKTMFHRHTGEVVFASGKGGWKGSKRPSSRSWFDSARADFYAAESVSHW